MGRSGEGEFDVVVVGAGPAGACAAIRAARRGLRMCLIEKEALPRYKTCGGGVLGRALLSLGVDIAPSIERECREVQLNIGKRLSFRAERAEPIVVMVMRDRFDHLLVEHAASAGAQLRTPSQVTSLKREGDLVRLETSGGTIAARYVIAADGAASAVAKLAGWKDERRMAPALECEVFVDEESFAGFSDAARFDFGLMPSGYAWVFPKRRHLSIGVMTSRPNGVNLNQYFERYLKDLSIKPTAIQRHGYVIPLSPRGSQLARGRVLLAGDAAGFADPVTAEGITYAIRSGQAAADAVANDLNEPTQVEMAYNEFAAGIAEEHRIARRLAACLYNFPRARELAFHWKGKSLVKAMTRLVTGEATYRTLFE